MRSRLSPDCTHTPRASISVARVPVRTSTPSRLQVARGALRGVGREGAEHAVLGLDEDDAGGLGVDRAKVVRNRVLGDLHHRAGQLDAGGAGADDDECQLGAPGVGVDLLLGGFEGEQESPADLDGILDGLEGGGVA